MKGKLIGIAVLLFVFVATPLKTIINWMTASPNDIAPSTSKVQARLTGVFVASFAPSITSVEGMTIKGAWLEHRSEWTTKWVWIPYRKRIEGYELIVKADNRRDDLWLTSTSTLYVTFSPDRDQFEAYVTNPTPPLYEFGVTSGDGARRRSVTNMVFRR